MKHRTTAWPALFAGVAICLLWTASIPLPAAELPADPTGVLISEEPDRSKSLAPYVPTPMEIVEEMLKMVDVKSSDVVYDLGCGDGRIVVMAAKKYGARGVGVDYDPERVREARALAQEEGVEKRVRIIQHDAMTVDFSSATIVTLYLLPESNAKLRPRLEKLLPVGARVVSHDFDMPVWKAIKIKNITDKKDREHTLYFWKITPEMKTRLQREPIPVTREGLLGP